jgi:hypothetical protein
MPGELEKNVVRSARWRMLKGFPIPKPIGVESTKRGFNKEKVKYQLQGKSQR